MVKPVPGPDRLEKGLRLGCGGLFGLLAAGPLLFRFVYRLFLRRWEDGTTWVLYATLAGATVLCALLALRYGDRFWDGFERSR